MPVASSQPASKGTTHFAADAGERRDDAAGLAVLHGRAAAWRGIRRTSLFRHLDASRRGTLNAFAYPTRESTFNLGPSGDAGDRRGNLETAHVEDLVIVHKVGVLDAVAAEDYAHHVRHSYPAIGLLLSPAFAGAAMALGSVSVVTNALRLNRVRL